ncbi:hypothetical protein OA094_01570 [Candidatus Pelagibacter sp.]|nr:hypothetical protein [Candidatus Pelagibacter sp.]
MIRKIALISRVNFQKRDYERYGVSILKKKFQVDILDLSRILIPRSKKYFKRFNSSNVIIIHSVFELIKILKSKKYNFAIEYLENSPKELLIRIIIKSNINFLIKYLGGVKPKIVYDDLKSNYVLTNFKKIFTNIKLTILTFINKFLIDLVLIPGQDFFYQKTIVKSAKKILYTNSFDFNEYLSKKKINKKKKYYTYIDQNFINHPDFYIKKRKPFVSENFYKALEIFFCKIEKKYKTKVIVCPHPKTNLKNFSFINKKRISKYKTFETIKDCSHVFAHYSTAISYPVLLKKSITFLTAAELKKKRQGYQTKIMAELLKSDLIDIDSKKVIKLNFKINKIKYNKFVKNYLCHPKSKGSDTWIYLSNYLTQK